MEILYFVGGLCAALLPFGLVYLAGRIDGRREWAMQQIRREQRQRHSLHGAEHE